MEATTDFPSALTATFLEQGDSGIDGHKGKGFCNQLLNIHLPQFVIQWCCQDLRPIHVCYQLCRSIDYVLLRHNHSSRFSKQRKQGIHPHPEQNDMWHSLKDAHLAICPYNDTTRVFMITTDYDKGLLKAISYC